MAEQDGFQRKGRINLRGVETVVKLRAKFGRQGVALKPASTYYDGSFYDTAMNARR